MLSLTIDRNELEYLVVDHDPLVFGFGSKDCDSSLEFRRLDVSDQTRHESTSKSVLQGGNRAGRSI